MARPSYKPTDDQRLMVKAMTGFGVPQEEIATVLDVTSKTLRKYFRRELSTGLIEAKAKVLQSIYKAATHDRRPNMVAAFGWMKQLGGWSEKIRHEHSGIDGTPIATTSVTLATDDPVKAAEAYLRMINGTPDE